MAKEPETHHPETEARLAELCAVMRDLKWRRGKSGPEYAEKWGLSLYRVEELSAEAWKRVAAEVKDHDYVNATVGHALVKVIEGASDDIDSPRFLASENGSREESAAVPRRTIIEAARVWADISGAKAPSRVELSEGATPAAAAHAVREMFRGVEPATDEDVEPAEPEPEADKPT